MSAAFLVRNEVLEMASRKGLLQVKDLRISAANIGPNRFHQNRTVLCRLVGQ